VVLGATSRAAQSRDPGSRAWCREGGHHGITVGLDATQWDIVTADEPIRTLTNRAGRTVQLDDVVVRATRCP
jgi:hypothetical protein